MLKRRLDNLEEVKKIACIVEDIDKLQEQMQRKEDHKISSFIFVYAQNIENSQGYFYEAIETQF